MEYRKDNVPLGLVQSSFKYENVTPTPPSFIDWTKKRAVTPIKSQEDCGGCWAFSAVAIVEGITAITSGKLIELYEQELIDCVEDCGCDGGWMDSAFDYIKYKGLSTETSYPYQGIDGTCSIHSIAKPAAHITGYERVPANSERALMKAVTNHPVSVEIDANSFSFQFYRSGVYKGYCGTSLDHAITVVGYEVDGNETKYWLVKNSWGTDWGERGYIRMKRGVNDPKGLCGITTEVSYYF